MNQNRKLSFNHILSADSYKLSHAFAYPDKVKGMFSYIEARTQGRDIIVPFGLQMWIQKFLTVPITTDMINEAEAFAAAHGEPFHRRGWEKIVEVYDGNLPVKIRAVPEGLPVRSGNVLVTIECDDPDLFWLSSYLETALQRGVWYPTTIASLDYQFKRDLRRAYEDTGADLAMLPFALHDFGGRGVTCAEQAEIGGAAHLVNFMGSDTMEGIRAANFYYHENMSGYSVYATEHSVECSFGSSAEDEIQYLRHQLSVAQSRKIGIISVVIDGYDVYRAAETLCTTLKDEIVSSGVKVVFRPDSGDALEIVPRIIRLQASTFGYTVNSRGFMKVNHVGCLQGDGVDRLSALSLLGKLMAEGFAADNVIFGSGGALLQKVNRDTFKFAQKASAILVDGSWVGISKNPATDPGKRSKQGRLTLVRSNLTGELSTADLDQTLAAEHEDVMQTVYDHGQIQNTTTLAEIRARAAV